MGYVESILRVQGHTHYTSQNLDSVTLSSHQWQDVSRDSFSREGVLPI